MFRSFKASVTGFGRHEDGAVTVDWVVLTAAIVGIGAGLIANISTGTNSMANVVSSAVASSQVGQAE